MNEKLKKLLASINARKQKIKDLVAEGKLEDAKNEKAQLIKEQQEFDLLYDLDDDPAGTPNAAAGAAGEGQPAGAVVPAGSGVPGAEGAAAPTAAQVGKALVAAIKARLKGKKAPKDAADVLLRDAQLHAEMIEGNPGEDTGEDGGLTVPRDITTQIGELRRATADDLEQYVNVERVSTKNGSRVIETDADTTEWPEGCRVPGAGHSQIQDHFLQDQEVRRHPESHRRTAGRHRREHPGLPEEVDRQEVPRNQKRQDSGSLEGLRRRNFLRDHRPGRAEGHLQCRS